MGRTTVLGKGGVESQDRRGMKLDTLNEYNLRNLIETKENFLMLLILYVR